MVARIRSAREKRTKNLKKLRKRLAHLDPVRPPPPEPKPEPPPETLQDDPQFAQDPNLATYVSELQARRPSGESCAISVKTLGDQRL